MLGASDVSLMMFRTNTVFLQQQENRNSCNRPTAEAAKRTVDAAKEATRQTLELVLAETQLKVAYLVEDAARAAVLLAQITEAATQLLAFKPETAANEATASRGTVSEAQGEEGILVRRAESVLTAANAALLTAETTVRFVNEAAAAMAAATAVIATVAAEARATAASASTCD